MVIGGTRGAISRAVLRVCLVWLLAMAPVVAWAEPQATEVAVAAAGAAGKQLAQLTAQQAQLAKQYQDQLAAVDRLKKEKASWRHDRELRDHLAESNDTAGQLSQVTGRIAAAQDKLAKARAAAVSAIDAELAAGGVASDRARELARLRVQLAPPAAPKKLVIPDAEIDPLADPDELDHQAAAVRAVESELARQVAGLDHQAAELAEVAALRKEHERTNEMALRDDDQPRRVTSTAARATGGAGGADNTPISGTQSPVPGTAGTQTPVPGPAGTGAGPDHSTDHFGASTQPYEADATVVLGDVIDHASIEGMLRASRSGDPAQRAEAAKRVRDAVKARLERLAKQREKIEQRSKALRQPR